MADLLYYLMVLIVGFTFFIFLFKRREVDFLFVYYVTLLLYNIPTLLGVVYEPNYAVFVRPVEDIYLTTSLIFASVIPFFYLSKEPHSNGAVNIEVKFDKFFLKALLALSLLGFVYNLPNLLNSSSKVELLESSSNIFLAVVYGTFPFVGFVLAYKLKERLFLFLFLLLSLLVLLFGSRRTFVLVVISYFVLSSKSKNIILAHKFSWMFLGLCALFFVVLGKTMYGALLRDGVSGLGVWAENFNSKYFLTGSEFMTNSAILNEVIYKNFEMPGEGILKSLLALQPIPLSYFNFSSSYFNDLFQHQLFYAIKYGMAYSPWAEAYGWLGNVGVLIYALTIPLLLHILWGKYKSVKSLSWKTIIFVLGVTLAFWVHRNSLATIIAYLRNIFYPSVFLFFLVYLYTLFLKNLSRVKLK